MNALERKKLKYWSPGIFVRYKRTYVLMPDVSPLIFHCIFGNIDIKFRVMTFVRREQRSGAVSQFGDIHLRLFIQSSKEQCYV